MGSEVVGQLWVANAGHEKGALPRSVASRNQDQIASSWAATGLISDLARLGGLSPLTNPTRLQVKIPRESIFPNPNCLAFQSFGNQPTSSIDRISRSPLYSWTKLEFPMASDGAIFPYGASRAVGRISRNDTFDDRTALLPRRRVSEPGAHQLLSPDPWIEFEVHRGSAAYYVHQYLNVLAVINPDKIEYGDMEPQTPPRGTGITAPSSHPFQMPTLTLRSTLQI